MFMRWLPRGGHEFEASAADAGELVPAGAMASGSVLESLIGATAAVVPVSPGRRPSGVPASVEAPPRSSRDVRAIPVSSRS